MFTAIYQCERCAVSFRVEKEPGYTPEMLKDEFPEIFSAKPCHCPFCGKGLNGRKEGL